MRYPEHLPFMKDSQHRFRTQSLFHEFRSMSDIEPIWTLKDEDVSEHKLPSLRRLYLEISDPTEYAFAMEAFGSWKHWLKIKNSKALQPWMDDWAFELEVKMRSEALLTITEEAKGGRSSFNAAKYLANGDWKPSKRGRPTKEEIEGEKKIASRLDAEIGEDAQRLGLTLLN